MTSEAGDIADRIAIGPRVCCGRITGGKVATYGESGARIGELTNRHICASRSRSRRSVYTAMPTAAWMPIRCRDSISSYVVIPPAAVISSEVAARSLLQRQKRITRNCRNLIRTLPAMTYSKAGWSWSRVSTVDSTGRTIWIVDAHRGDGKRFVVHADEILTAFLELESATGVQASQSVLNTVLLAKNHNVEAAPHH